MRCNELSFGFASRRPCRGRHSTAGDLVEGLRDGAQRPIAVPHAVRVVQHLDVLEHHPNGTFAFSEAATTLPAWAAEVVARQRARIDQHGLGARRDGWLFEPIGWPVDAWRRTSTGMKRKYASSPRGLGSTPWPRRPCSVDIAVDVVKHLPHLARDGGKGADAAGTWPTREQCSSPSNVVARSMTVWCTSVM